jgi:GNAT superfamily N-acetyltransferase
VDESLTIDDDPDESIGRFLDERLYEYNVAATGVTDGRVFAIVVHDERGDIVAGLTGSTWGGCLEIGRLWVRADQRGQGYGTRLLAVAEQEARAHGCRKAVLDTHSFQAPDFYQRRGYSVYGVLDDYPLGHRKYFLKKDLR